MPRKSPPAIVVRGARQNNLKGVDVEVPLNRLTVVTGPSGSGKSSLAFHTLYAEGQRRYVETFSPYTRQFFDRMDKPDADEISGIPPAIAIEQNNQIKTTRSTVGTLTEINDYLKLYFAKVVTGSCPECGHSVAPETAGSITEKTLAKFAGQNMTVAFSIPTGENADVAEFFGFLQGQGFLRIRINDSIYRTDDPEAYDLDGLPSVVQVLQDRMVLRKNTRSRLSEAVEAALHFGKGKVTLIGKDGDSEEFSTSWHCANCDISITPPSPALFNFNHPLGACPACRGFGRTIGIDLARAIPDPGLSIAEGAVLAFKGPRNAECQEDLLRYSKKRGLDVDAPFAKLSKIERDWVLYGDKGAKGDPEKAWRDGLWYGVQGFFDWVETKAYKMHVRVFLSRFRSYTACRSCAGGRLQPASMNYRWGGLTLPGLWQLPISELHAFFKKHAAHPADDAEALLIEQIGSRIGYLLHVGLGYLTLDRSARSLSGGELQRVNLTTCLGARLVNTLFVLDEPSIGLHPRDTGRLIDVLHGLRDVGNTLVVVEHEESVMRAADHIIDIGPGRGADGGEICYAGGVGRLTRRRTLTGDYLGGRSIIEQPEKRRVPLKSRQLRLSGIYCHNLEDLDVSVPLGLFTCVTGVSGSGKSTLIHSVLYRNLKRRFGEIVDEEPGRVRSLKGHRMLDGVQLVDQSPLSRTPRSTPAVYTGVFDAIRKLFVGTPEAKIAGLTPGFFSFNSGTGRCERCSGMGFEKVEMQFLSDVFVTCPECEGRRFQPHALEYLYREKSINDVLQMTIAEAREWFDSDEENRLTKQIDKGLSVLCEVGLGYLRLGQPLNTLSGGESQRLKIVGHLLEGGAKKRYLMLFDEPTTGLHFDDIAMLVRVLHRLVEEGNSVVVIEHNIDLVRCADYIIDLGPEAGSGGGKVVVTGTPEEVARCAKSHTGRFLAAGPRTVVRRVAEEEGPYMVRDRDSAATAISVRGARENNLKDIDVSIPRGKTVVVTGLSGSGKSTLAFDILFAEGQRRFLDSMSAYARQFAQQFQRPDVDFVSGLPPTVAIEQRITRGGGKSTVATVTEVYHFLRLLYSKLGRQHCPDCDVPVEKQSLSAILTEVRKAANRGPVSLMANVIKARKGFHTDVAEAALRRGYERMWVDGRMIETAEFVSLKRYQEHTIHVVVAEIASKVKPDDLQGSVREALQVGKGTALLRDKRGKTTVLSSEMVCPECSRAFEELDPRLFSYHSPHGWCHGCRGLGMVAAQPLWFDESGMSRLAAELEEERRLTYEQTSEWISCPECDGARLNVVARSVDLQGARIHELCALQASQARAAVETMRFSGTEARIARDIVKEVAQRLRFLEHVGLDYLQLDRAVKTLSGGESQRIRLAAQLGSNLRGVLYVLDEPTIGLHPRDNDALLKTLRGLRDQGNSLVVVEHDEATMSEADVILDLGPGAGRLGGEVVAKGTLKQIQRLKKSVTGQYLRNPQSRPSRGGRRPLPAGSTKGWLRLRGASANNLRDIDVKIPLRRLVCLSGVSGSGKSSLMRGVLEPAAREEIAKGRGGRKPRKKKSAKTWKSMAGFKEIAAVYEVDQSPIGKTSRSTPSTYVKVFDEIRKLFSGVPAARIRGYTPGRFSFNTADGRCESCSGHGQIKLEMNFLPSCYVRCEACNGLRYNNATLEVEYHDKNIGQVMNMTVDEAADFFSSNPKIHRTLSLLQNTGLGYLHLGQPSPTLSGGEAQRIKLVAELTKGVGRSQTAKMRGGPNGKSNLYLIEEPSIGLHMADVDRLVSVLHALVDDGHTVIVIEHNLDILCEADYLIDIGPEAGADGGKIVAAGTPEQVAKSRKSRTAPFLREMLK